MNLFSRVLKNVKLSGYKGAIIALLGICTSCFFLYTSFAGSMMAYVQRGLLLVLILPIIFLLTSGKSRNPAIIFIDYVFLLLSTVPFIYIIVIRDQLVARGGIPNTLDIIMGIAAVLIVLEATRRKVGLALPILAVVLLIYGFFGPFIPGVLQHRGLDLGTMVSALFLSEEGIFGIPIEVTSEFIMIFVIFGAFLQESGAGEFFIDIATAGFGWMRGGPAKAAVVSSALMGTVSGSAVANVVTTGTFTIPLMKRSGYRSEVAGAVEAVASSGGQIMPPIMGAAAFIMADFLKVPYIDVIVAAAVPACLYYLALFFMVDLEAVKQGLKGIPRIELPDWKKIILGSGYLLIPVFVLIVLLGFIQYSAQKSAFYSIVCLFIVASFKAHTRMNTEKVLTALVKAALGGLEVAAVCACAGIAIGIIMRSGLGFTLTGILIEVSHGSLVVLMVLTMLTSTILGMGLPTSACYIIVAVLIAPAMIQLGVAPMAAHLFAFYYATLSAITPPVALAAYAGAAIAESSPMRTGLHAFRLGLTGFVVPFMFVYGPQLLIIGPVPEIVLACLTAMMGCYALAIALVGVMFIRVAWWARVLSFAAALLLIKPGAITDAVGFIFLAVVIGVNYYMSRRTDFRN
jgi:TRAP transporter 4TM/12TM fusion protein